MSGCDPRNSQATSRSIHSRTCRDNLSVRLDYHVECGIEISKEVDLFDSLGTEGVQRTVRSITCNSEVAAARTGDLSCHYDLSICLKRQRVGKVVLAAEVCVH